MNGKHSLQITELVIQHKTGYKEDSFLHKKLLILLCPCLKAIQPLQGHSLLLTFSVSNVKSLRFTKIFGSACTFRVELKIFKVFLFTYFLPGENIFPTFAWGNP